MKYKRRYSDRFYSYGDRINKLNHLTSMEMYDGEFSVDDYENPYAIEQLIDDIDSIDNPLGLYAGQTFHTNRGTKGVIVKWDREYVYVRMGHVNSRGKLELIGRSIFLD